MHHFIMYTDRDTGEGKISLRANYTINYTNPDDLIDALNAYDNIIGIPENKWNTGFDFLYMKFHNDKVIHVILPGYSSQIPQVQHEGSECHFRCFQRVQPLQIICSGDILCQSFNR